MGFKKLEKSTRRILHLNRDNELKSTSFGREFQTLMTRSLKKVART